MAIGTSNAATVKYMVVVDAVVGKLRDLARCAKPEVESERAEARTGADEMEGIAPCLFRNSGSAGRGCRGCDLRKVLV